jgi:uncharacterized protein
MLIYAAADIHGRPDRIRSIQFHTDLYRPDVLVLAGDISHRWRPDRVLDLLNRLSLPVLMVRGNGDSRRLDALLAHYPNLRSLHLSRECVGGVAFVGIGGTLPLPLHSRLAFREIGMQAHVSGMLSEGAVLVVHPPPYGVRDRILGKFHAGSHAVRRLMDQDGPGLILCGHIHEQAGVEVRGRTVVVNCAMGSNRAGVLIRYNGTASPACTMLRMPKPR